MTGSDSRFEVFSLVVGWTGGCQGPGRWQVMVEAWAGMGNVGFARSEGMGLCREHRGGTLPASHRAMGQTQGLADLALHEGP